MSWSISKLYRNPAETKQEIAKESLPDTVKAYITAAVDGLPKERAETPILVHGYGHLCHEGPGGGNYEVTTARLVVVPVPFNALLTLPLQVV